MRYFEGDIAQMRRLEPHWDDMLRLAGSLKLGRVPAAGIMRKLQVGERPTRLAPGHRRVRSHRQNLAYADVYR
jgi:TnpA family transposase